MLLCLASKKSSEREFFVPAGTHLGVKLLRVFGPPRLAPYQEKEERYGAHDQIKVSIVAIFYQANL